jgi:hypothetical protein
MSTSIPSCTDLLWQWISCTITQFQVVQPSSSNCAINARKKDYSESSWRISRGERRHRKRHTQSSRARDRIEREREREETREKEGSTEAEEASRD